MLRSMRPGRGAVAGPASAGEAGGRPRSGYGSAESSGPARFKLLASAIAGRPLEVAWTEAGELPWSDGATVFIQEKAHPQTQLAQLSLQASMLGGESLSPEVVVSLARHPGLARRFLAVEGHRALRAHEHLVPPSVRRLAEPPTSGFSLSPSDSMTVARSRSALGEPPEWFGAIHPRRLRAAAERQRDRSSTQRHAPRPAGRDKLQELEESEEVDVDLFSSPVGGGGSIGRLLQRLFSDARSGSGAPGADSPTKWARTGGRPKGTAGAMSTAVAPIPVGTDAARGAGVTYPEWDERLHRYRPNWCTVIEQTPSDPRRTPTALPDTRPLHRALARLGLGIVRLHRRLEGDEIDIDAACEAQVELAAGCVPDENVYIQSLRRRSDLSVLVLLDVSASAAEPSTSMGQVHDHQRSAAAALTATLNELGNRVGLYGFRSQGRAEVQILRIKSFGERFGGLTLAHLGASVPFAYTRLGAAIRHGAALLEQDAGTTRRLLLVISDGIAYDHGYDRVHGEADARRALAETRRRGIGCVCISVGAGTDAEELRRVFGTAAYAAVDRSEYLPRVVGPLFRSALLAAEMRRKVSQRRTRSTARHETDKMSA